MALAENWDFLRKTKPPPAGTAEQEEELVKC